MMTCFYSLNSNNTFQVLRNFTSSLETNNANLALNSQLMMAILLGRNISGYRNWILATFSNFTHFTFVVVTRVPLHEFGKVQRQRQMKMPGAKCQKSRFKMPRSEMTGEALLWSNRLRGS